MGGRSIKVTQIAFPDAISNAVHVTGVYASRGVNPISAQSDGIFAEALRLSSCRRPAARRAAMRPASRLACQRRRSHTAGEQ
jgi:hypothetical protein